MAPVGLKSWAHFETLRFFLFCFEHYPLVCMRSIRYLQYLLRDEGVQLSWVGTGRLNFSLDFDDAALALLRLLNA